MKNRNFEDGYSSIGVLLILIFLSSLTMAVLVYTRSSTEQYRRMENVYRDQQELELAVRELISEMEKDPTPSSDSPYDPVWNWLEDRNNEDIILELKDISSRFNLNFMRTKMLEKSVFSSMMINGHSPEDLKQFRGEQGFSDSLLDGYGDFFSEEDLLEYFTVYSYANLNVTYEDSLKKLYELQVDEAGSHIFLSKIQSLVSSQKIADENRLQEILGSQMDNLYPLINIEPLLNVNFVNETVLKSVLFYPYGEEVLKNANNYLEIILAERSAMEIDSRRLDSILQVDDSYLRILQYLGTVTWYWEIHAKKDGISLSVVLTRLPQSDEMKDNPVYRIVEWYFKS